MKVGGKIFFEWDIEMYDPKTDEPAKANTSDINEELGQVCVIWLLVGFVIKITTSSNLFLTNCCF